MSLLVDSPQRRKLRTLVSKAFLKAQWEVNGYHGDTHDFVVVSKNLRFLVKCLDAGVSKLQGANKTIEKVESVGLELKARLQRTLLIVMEDNFLVADLKSLSERRLFFIPLKELHQVTSLSVYGDTAPEGLAEWQTRLLTSNADYSLFVSKLLRKSGNFEEAAQWASYCVENSVTNLEGHLNLFQLLLRLEAYEKAEAVSQVMQRIYPNDINVLTALKAFANKRGRSAELNDLNERIKDARREPSTFKGLLDKNLKPYAQAESNAKCPGDASQQSTSWYEGFITKWIRFRERS